MAKKKIKLFVAANAVGRPRKIQSPEEMAEMWDRYTEMCDNHVRVQTVICNGETSEVEIRAPLTYTIEGFCLSIPISQTAFDETYRNDPDYRELISLIEDMTHIDAKYRCFQAAFGVSEPLGCIGLVSRTFLRLTTLIQLNDSKCTLLTMHPVNLESGF